MEKINNIRLELNKYNLYKTMNMELSKCKKNSLKKYLEMWQTALK